MKLLLEEALAQQRDKIMNKFSQILRRLQTTIDASTSSRHFEGVAPFKVQVHFDIHVFEGQIYVDASKKWVNLLEGYILVYNFSNRENIAFPLLKVVPHIKDWWETYCEQISIDESEMFGTEPTWAYFVDTLKGKYYPSKNYEDQYTRWTTLRQERDQAVLKFTNIFHTLGKNMGISDCKWHLVIKYSGYLHKYIQIEMEFLDISSLGDAYQ